MSKYRLVSMLHYGAAALATAAVLMLTSYAAVLVIALTWGIAAVADRFVNSDAEPDDRLRSFVIYTVGAVVGLLVILMFSSRLGWWTFIAPIIAFGLLALFDYFVPPATYQPRDPHRYGESPPVTVR
jgi:predicted membrane channel-forming protein YqfA (hemolysin III family)